MRSVAVSCEFVNSNCTTHSFTLYPIFVISFDESSVCVTNKFSNFAIVPFIYRLRVRQYKSHRCSRHDYIGTVSLEHMKCQNRFVHCEFHVEFLFSDRCYVWSPNIMKSYQILFTHILCKILSH